jgi:dynein heavy chain 2
MDLDHVDGRLRIQYSDRLVTLLREVRQLSALGFAIPAKIQQAANTADKFYGQAIVLKQVRKACTRQGMSRNSTHHPGSREAPE